MPRGARPGERRGGGKKPGQKLRRTILKEIIEEIAEEKIEKRMPRPVSGPGRKRAIDHLDDMLHMHVGLAARLQQKRIDQYGGIESAAEPLAQDPHFRYLMEQAKDCAAKLAPYQSPTFRAIVVAPAPEQRPGELRKRFTLTIFEDGKAVEANSSKTVDSRAERQAQIEQS